MYTRESMRNFDANDGPAVLDHEETDTEVPSKETVREITNQVRKHTRITFHTIGAASSAETEQLLRGVQELRSNPAKIHEWEGFIQWSEKAIESAQKIFRTLESSLTEASSAANGWISTASKDEWIKRFKDQSVGYKQKEYWVLYQLPHYMDAWKEAAEKRKELTKQEGFADLVRQDPRFAVLGKSETFLSLHYDKRKSLLAEANAAMLASEQMQTDLYRRAQTKLHLAAKQGILSQHKVGQWLERIFRGKSDRKHVETFIDGSAANALPTLMQNWKKVKERYDAVVKKFHRQGEDELPRGIHLASEHQFLGMHYQSRLHYVEEMERRLMHGSDLSKEPASFVNIRHAIDTKDWTEAAMMIAKAKHESLSDDHRARLESMNRYVRRFAGKNDEAPDTFENAMKAKRRLDELLHQVPSSMQSMITRLLRGPNANRSIHQFRWIVYNNKWCRAHGYLDFQRAMKGASKDHEKETKFRKEHGMDTGLHDSIGHETADQAYFREKEFANHKATYLHINLGSGAPNTLAEWLEHERDPKVLYWTTFCGHENGLPMPDNWHNDLFHILTEMRSLTSTLKKSGFLYRSPNQNLMAM